MQFMQVPFFLLKNELESRLRFHLPEPWLWLEITDQPEVFSGGKVKYFWTSSVQWERLLHIPAVRVSKL